MHAARMRPIWIKRTGAVECHDTIGNHTGIEAQSAPVAHIAQQGIRHFAKADLQHGAVFNEYCDVIGNALCFL